MPQSQPASEREDRSIDPAHLRSRQSLHRRVRNITNITADLTMTERRPRSTLRSPVSRRRPRSPTPSSDPDNITVRHVARPKRQKLEVPAPPFAPPIKYGHHGQVVPTRLQLSLISCDGGEYSDPAHPNLHLGAKNILRHDRSVYCSERRESNIVLRHQDEGTPFVLESLVIVGPDGGFTAPVREGTIHVAMTLEELKPCITEPPPWARRSTTNASSPAVSRTREPRPARRSDFVPMLTQSPDRLITLSDALRDEQVNTALAQRGRDERTTDPDASDAEHEIRAEMAAQDAEGEDGGWYGVDFPRGYRGLTNAEADGELGTTPQCYIDENGVIRPTPEELDAYLDRVQSNYGRQEQSGTARAITAVVSDTDADVGPEESTSQEHLDFRSHRLSRSTSVAQRRGWLPDARERMRRGEPEDEEVLVARAELRLAREQRIEAQARLADVQAEQNRSQAGGRRRERGARRWDVMGNGAEAGLVRAEQEAVRRELVHSQAEAVAMLRESDLWDPETGEEREGVRSTTTNAATSTNQAGADDAFAARGLRTLRDLGHAFGPPNSNRTPPEPTDRTASATVPGYSLPPDIDPEIDAMRAESVVLRERIARAEELERAGEQFDVALAEASAALEADNERMEAEIAAGAGSGVIDLGDEERGEGGGAAAVPANAVADRDRSAADFAASIDRELRMMRGSGGSAAEFLGLRLGETNAQAGPSTVEARRDHFPEHRDEAAGAPRSDANAISASAGPTSNPPTARVEQDTTAPAAPVMDRASALAEVDRLIRARRSANPRVPMSDEVRLQRRQARSEARAARNAAGITREEQRRATGTDRARMTIEEVRAAIAGDAEQWARVGRVFGVNAGTAAAVTEATGSRGGAQEVVGYAGRTPAMATTSDNKDVVKDEPEDKPEVPKDDGVTTAHFSIKKGKHKVAIKFEPAVSGRFILLKLLGGQGRGNVDVQSVVAWGFGGGRFFPAVQAR